MDTTNENSSDNIDIGRCNNLVAESDLRAACDAIRATALVPNVAEALVQHIHRIVQPIDDEGFHTYKRKVAKEYHQQGDEKKLRVTDSNATRDEKVDPALLLDQEAYQRVKELRHQVRIQADKVAQTRQEALDRAVKLAKQQTLVMESTKVTCATNDDTDKEVKHQALLEKLKQTLGSLSNAIEATEKLPSTVNSISQTLSVVQAHLKSNDKENHIEKAIRGSPETIPKQGLDNNVDAMSQLQAYLDG